MRVIMLLQTLIVIACADTIVPQQEHTFELKFETNVSVGLWDRSHAPQLYRVRGHTEDSEAPDSITPSVVWCRISKVTDINQDVNDVDGWDCKSDTFSHHEFIIRHALVYCDRVPLHKLATVQRRCRLNYTLHKVR